MDRYGLHPANYLTLPAYSWSAALKSTGVELELITDVDCFQFMETSLRGGICFIGQREARANLPHRNDFNPKLPTQYIKYFDINNL